jgi:hypothetical protein
MMEYKGYMGIVEYDDEAKIFHGDIINTRDVITFQGTTVVDEIWQKTGRFSAAREDEYREYFEGTRIAYRLPLFSLPLHVPQPVKTIVRMAIWRYGALHPAGSHLSGSGSLPRRFLATL